MLTALYKKLPIMLALSGLAAVSCVSSANATTLSGVLTADNAFFAYVSTDNTVLGTLVAQGNDWGSPVSFDSYDLTPGQTYYLQVEAINYGGPGGLLGQFDLSDTGFQFANGSQTVLTDTPDWLAAYNDSNADPTLQQPWVTPVDGILNLGTNGVGPWGNMSSIDPGAAWIDDINYGLNDCGYCTVDFSTTIADPTSTPEPGTLGLLGGALMGVFTLVRSRRKIR